MVTVDQIDGIALARLEDLAVEALELGQRALVNWYAIISGSRRLRGPIRGGVAAEERSDTESFLDRFAAIQHVVSATHVPTVSALVGSAEEIVGGVLRDVDIIQDWLARARPGDVELRQALITGLAMMGTPAPLELSWPDPTDPEEAKVYLVSIALGADDPRERLRLAEKAGDRSRGAAIAVVEQALLRIEDGCRISVVY